MKQKSKKDSIDLSQIVHTELTALITDNDATYRDKHLKSAQKLSTLKFKEMPKSAKIADFVGSLVKDYQLLVDHIDSKLSGGLQKIKGQTNINDTSEAITDIDRQIQVVDDQITPLKGKFDQSGKKYAPKIRNWVWMRILLVLIASIELIANYEVFSSLGGGFLTNIGIAVLVSLICYWYAHFTPDKSKKFGNGNPKRELLIFGMMTIPIVIAFYAFSAMRISYLQNLNPNMSDLFNTNPWVNTIINTLAYIISCWIVWAYKPSVDTINAYKKYVKDAKEIKALETQKEDLFKQRASLSPELRGKLTHRYNVLLLGQQFEAEVQTRMEACYEQFKMELFLLSNGACSPLFTGNIDKDLPKLKLNYTNIESQIPQK